jgi:ubiquinone/menaquinone biosynthesis C-methylase UbiE
MLRRITQAAVAITIAVAIAGSASAQVHTDSVHHRFDDASHWAQIFDSPERVEWQQPDKVVEAMKLHDRQTVVDIGAGTGFFTWRFAKAVGPSGQAVGLDIEPNLVDYMKADAKKRGLTNYSARLVKPDDPELAPHSVDVIFFCDALHHIESRAAYLHKLVAALKPGGRVIDVDFKKEPLPVGPPPEHKLAREEVISEFREAGFRLLREHDFLKYQYFLEFSPQ